MGLAADVIIAGLGAMGSAAAYHLARRGRKVFGFDQFTPPHDQGSTHGESRIIREAYYEDPRYVPLVQRAYRLWAELSREWGQQLLLQTGGLMIGPPRGTLVGGALLSAQTHGLAHEQLSAHDIERRFPALHPSSDMAGLWEPRAGILFPEKCVQAHLDLAEQHGAVLRMNELILRWHEDSRGVQVESSKGRYRGAQLLVTAGSWVRTLLPSLPVPFRVERPATFWFEPKHPALFHSARCPIHLWEHEAGQFFYGMPDLGQGVKVALHHGQRVQDPSAVDRTISDKETQLVETLVQRYLPDLSKGPKRASVCLYTNTPDGHFYIDRVSGLQSVWVASPCSGHGFKFSSVLGEIMAQLLHGEAPACDISLFGHRTFQEAP